jgi:hypothetical protein
MSTSFAPRICECSFAQYRHVVKTKADWARHLAKQRQDISENITGDFVRPPAQPQYHDAQKGTAAPMGKVPPQHLAEIQQRYMVEQEQQHMVLVEQEQDMVLVEQEQDMVLVEPEQDMVLAEKEQEYLELPTLQMPSKRGPGKERRATKRTRADHTPREESMVTESGKGRRRVSACCNIIDVVIKSRLRTIAR